MPIVPNFKKIKWGDFEAELSPESLKEIEQSVANLKPSKDKVKGYTIAEVKELAAYLLALVKTDPVLAIVKLVMEIELVIRNVYLSKVDKKYNATFDFNQMLFLLETETDIDKAVLHAAKEVMLVRNNVVHGESVAQETAYKIIKIGLIVLGYFYGYSKALKDTHKLFEI